MLWSAILDQDSFLIGTLQASKNTSTIYYQKKHLFARMKRQVIASTNDVASKKVKDGVNDFDSSEMESLSEFQSVQSRLMGLDDECVKEQLKIQRKFAGRMRPLMVERQGVIEKIPNFWGRVLNNIPLDEDQVFCPEDAELLPELELVDLDDNIDDRGSYKLTMRFSPKAKEYFSPSVIEKTVIFDDKSTGEPTVTCTKIEWVPGKNIVEKVRERRRKTQEGDGDDEDLEFSLFEWFTSNPDEITVQLGEIIRRQVWQNPILFLYDGFGEDSDDDDEEDDDEAEDEVDEEQ